MRYILIALSLLAFFLGSAKASFGACTDNRHSSVLEEFEASKYVLVGSQIREVEVTSTDDPGGVAATIYSINPIEQFKGSQSVRFDIWSENSTSRFVMENGIKYLLFIKSGPDGLYVDNCGNSARMDDRSTTRVLKEVRSLNSKQH